MPVLGVDPGNTIGWSLLEADGTPAVGGPRNLPYGQEKHEGWALFLQEHMTLDLEAVIIEDYRIRHKFAKTHIGARLVAVEVIGKTTAWAQMRGIPVIMQEASILPLAQKMTGMDMKKMGAHADTHWVSAYNHAAYYLMRQGTMKQPGLEAYAPRKKD